MDNVSLVQVLQTEQCLSQDVLAGVLRVLRAHASDKRSQGLVHDFYEDPQAPLVIILVVDGEHEVIILAHIHQGNLVDHELLLALIFQILNKFERKRLIVTLAHHSEYFSEASRSQLVPARDVVVQAGVLSFELRIRL